MEATRSLKRSRQLVQITSNVSSLWAANHYPVAKASAAASLSMACVDAGLGHMAPRETFGAANLEIQELLKLNLTGFRFRSDHAFNQAKRVSNSPAVFPETSGLYILKCQTHSAPQSAVMIHSTVACCHRILLHKYCIFLSWQVPVGGVPANCGILLSSLMWALVKTSSTISHEPERQQEMKATSKSCSAHDSSSSFAKIQQVTNQEKKH